MLGADFLCIIRSMEKWRTIESHPKYQVSDSGRVRNLRTQRALKLRIYKGYVVVDLVSAGSVHHKKRIHRLVAEAFIGGIPDGHHVDHIDNDRTNNTLANLQVLAPGPNIRKRLRRDATFIEQVIRYHEQGMNPEEIRSKMFIW